MVDQPSPADQPIQPVCPWCSTPVAFDTPTCPSCAAILISDEMPDLPGVTAIDVAAMRREVKQPKSRSRLLSWISGEYSDEAPSVAESDALAPPDAEVQREILRLALEAEIANLQAEAQAIRSEALAAGRIVDAPEPEVGATDDDGSDADVVGDETEDQPAAALEGATADTTADEQPTT